MKASRRDLMKLAGPAVAAELAGEAAPLTAGKGIYESIGVKPLINARGTFTIISGSTMLPEAREAMALASQRYVHMDELMDAVGVRLAELTGAEFGLVSNGCSAALTHATAACVAGGNPDLHVRIPDLRGFAKDEVIVPTHSRNVYDAALRSVGVKILEVSTVEELELAIGPKTAMIYILAGPPAEKGPLAFEKLTPIAAKHKIPVLVDAAAEVLTVPNVHLQRGATLVAYSGGKCIRGPQTAGLLLGRKDLVQAAWVHSAPHHGFARSLKIGKEETLGMLMAVETWMKRDHKAEWQRWMGWLRNVQGQLAGVPEIEMKITETDELSNRTPALEIRWDAAKLGVRGADVHAALMAGEPRMTCAVQNNGINIVAYMMAPGDDALIGPRLKTVLGSLASLRTAPLAPPSVQVSGRWEVTIQYLSGVSKHTVHLFQDGAALTGDHQGDFATRPLRGTVSGAEVDFSSSLTERHGDSLQFRFTGKMDGAVMAGALDMGEYRSAKWTARRLS